MQILGGVPSPEVGGSDPPMLSMTLINVHRAYAGVVELADTHGLGPCARNGVQVQVLSSVPWLNVLTDMMSHCLCDGRGSIPR